MRDSVCKTCFGKIVQVHLGQKSWGMTHPAIGLQYVGNMNCGQGSKSMALTYARVVMKHRGFHNGDRQSP